MNNEHTCKAKDDILKKQKEAEDKDNDIKKRLLPFTEQLVKDFCCIVFPVEVMDKPGKWFQKATTKIEKMPLTTAFELFPRGHGWNEGKITVFCGNGRLIKGRRLDAYGPFDFYIDYNKDKSKYTLSVYGRGCHVSHTFTEDEYSAFYEYVLGVIMADVKYEYKQ